MNTYDQTKLKTFDLEKAMSGDPICTTMKKEISYAEQAGEINYVIRRLLKVDSFRRFKMYHAPYFCVIYLANGQERDKVLSLLKDEGYDLWKPFPKNPRAIFCDSDPDPRGFNCRYAKPTNKQQSDQ